MADDISIRVIAIIQDTLSRESGKEDLTLSPDDSMETVPEWDSLNFLPVFLSINDAFGIEPDFDEAIHYTSVSSLTEFLRSVTA